MKKLLLAILLLCQIPLYAATLRIVPLSGQEQSIALSRIGKWVFRGETLQLLDKRGNLITEENTADVRKIIFCEDTETAVGQTETASVVVYPNPASDILYIQGAGESPSVGIYTADGQNVFSGAGTQCYVGNLPAGTYLLRIGTQVTRFIKQ